MNICSGRINRLVFWDPSQSPHKMRLIDSIAEYLPSFTVQAYAHENVLEERIDQGWSIDGNSAVRWKIQPTDYEIDIAVAFDIEHTLHIFSGIRWVSTIVSALKKVRKLNARFAIMHEPRVREGWKGEVRFIQSWATEGWLRRNVEFILAIGQNGPTWFESVGYKRDRVFPFAYFVDPPIYHKSSSTSLHGPIRIGYVGRLVESKGVFDLLEATALLSKQASLTFVGIGAAEAILRQRATTLSVKANFMGVVPIVDIGKVMSQFDVLVLASTTKDGWGVVISEALMCGTAVICTPQVGASLLMAEPIFGKCVPACQPQAITNAILELHIGGAFTEARRQHRHRVACARLSAAAGAQYFCAILDFRTGHGVTPIPFYEYKELQS